MTFTQAEYLFKCFIHDSGQIGEKEQPNKELSLTNSKGSWLLKTITGTNIAIVSKEGKVEPL
jgi:hypothetical protein